MARYRAKHPIFIGSVLHGIGAEFESDLPPGRNWEPVDAAAKAAAAKTNPQPMPKMPGEHRTAIAEIPDDWESLAGLQILNLAKKFGLPKTGKLADAKALIEKEVAARQIAAAA